MALPTTPAEARIPLPGGMDPALWAAVNAWDAERCRLHEKWHGGYCAPSSTAHKINTAPMLLPAITAYAAALSLPTSGDAAPVDLEQENAVLRAALSALPAIAEECRVKWDAGMKAGKLLIALTDPTLRYRADITELHRVAALPTARERAQAATIATLIAQRDTERREGERARAEILRLEWSPGIYDPNLPLDESPRCPSCGARAYSGHEEGCALAALRAATQDGPAAPAASTTEADHPAAGSARGEARS